MSSAKRVVDSTIRRILMYTSEIIVSIILLVLLSLPLVFAVPMWVQEIVFDVPSSNLAVNPIAWFGPFATFGITIILGIFSFILGYLFLNRITISTKSKTVSAEEVKEAEDSEEEKELEESIEEELLSELDVSETE